MLAPRQLIKPEQQTVVVCYVARLPPGIVGEHYFDFEDSCATSSIVKSISSVGHVPLLLKTGDTLFDSGFFVCWSMHLACRGINGGNVR